MKLSKYRERVLTLYKMILVDDESIVLTQLKSLINWQLLGFEIVGTFPNASEAIVFVQNNEVNAVITDIKMSGMSGVDFAEYCHANYPEIKFALVSAYRDFEYAHSAIKYNVVNYIIKPIVRDELINTVKNIYVQLNKTLSYTNFSDKYLQASCQQIFSDLLCGIKTNPQDLLKLLNSVNMRISSVDTPCALINIIIEDFNNYLENIWKHESFRFYNAVSLLIPFELSSCYSSLIRYSQGKIEIILIAKNPANDFDIIIEEYINELKNNLNEFLKLSPIVNVNEKFSSISEIFKFQDNQTPVTQDIIHNDTINKVIEYIKSDYASISTLEDVAKFANLNPVYFGVFFKQHMNESFTNFLNKTRIDMAKELLKNKDIKVFSVGEMVGYKSVPYFFKTFKAITNMTPAQYKEKLMKGETE